MTREELSEAIRRHDQWLQGIYDGKRADFYQEIMWGVVLDGKRLIGAGFEGADLRGASFRNADLNGADFTDADLRGADFTWANLDGFDFVGANMENVTLHLANTAGADFTGTTQEQANGNHQYPQSALIRQSDLPFEWV